MPLRYIINTLARELGAQNIDQRPVLLARINQAAKELYESVDLPGSLREATFEISSGAIIALPYYVGPLRAMRHSTQKYKVELRDMMPRYNYQAWDQDWDRWRVMNTSPIQRSIVNSALPIFLSVTDVDSVDVNITLVGATANATRTRETLTLAAGELSVQTTEEFTSLLSITKDITNNRDITVTGSDADAAEIELAVIPNDRLESIYTIVDVSEYPGLSADCMDVLYKQPLHELKNDGDTFPCDGFDDAIVYMALHIYYANQADGGEKALGYYNKVNQIIYNRTIHVQGSVQKEVTFAPNPLFNITPRRRPVGSSLFSGRRYR